MVITTVESRKPRRRRCVPSVARGLLAASSNRPSAARFGTEQPTVEWPGLLVRNAEIAPACAQGAARLQTHQRRKRLARR